MNAKIAMPLVVALCSLSAACGGSGTEGGPSSDPTYTVTYSGNSSTGGTVPSDPGAYAQGQTVTVLGNTGGLVRTGFTFGGWNTQASGAGTTYTAGQTFTMGAASVVLHAVWTPVPTFTVTYDGNSSTGGTVPSDPGAYAQGQTVTVLGNTGGLVRTGFTFGGWNTQASGAGTTYAAGQTFTMGAASVVLHAVWTAAALDDFALLVAMQPATGEEPTLLKNGALTLVKDIRPGASGSSPRWFAELGGKVYFTADDGTNGRQIWSTDLTESGTVKVTQMPSSYSILHLHACNGKLFLLRMGNASDAYRLWACDPADGSCSAIKDAELNLNFAVSNGRRACYGGNFYFVAGTSASGDEIWKSDGTAGGTVILKDIVTGTSGSSPGQMTLFGGRLFFAASTNAAGTELWSTDGTEAGTAMVVDHIPGSGGSGPDKLTVSGGWLFFSADTPDNLGIELHAWDGSSISLVKDVAGGPTTGMTGYAMADVGGTLMFFGNATSTGIELWTSGGMTSSTTVAATLTATGGFGPGRVMASRNRLYFSREVNMGADEIDLWVSDGTGVGTGRILDPGHDPFLIEWTGRYSGNAFVKGDLGATYFVAKTLSSGYELWSTNGSPLGTSLVTDHNPGAGDGVRRQ